MNELQVYESQPLTSKDIQDKVALIQDVMKHVMKDGEHYGKIPGCGDKPALLKPGAEKLNLTFRMAPDFEIETVDLGKGHREYRIKCSLKSITSGQFLGMGVGSATTMESKWRFRNAEPEITDKPVPREYWEVRKADAAKAQEMIGGKGFTTKKIDGAWKIAKLTGEKVEHDNPADYYNTCLKMAKKRSHVDAVLTVTAASDIFTQDVEEMVENGTVTPPPDKPLDTTNRNAPDAQDAFKGHDNQEPLPNPTGFVAVESVEVKNGVSNGKKWTLYTILAGGEKYNTFDTKLSDLAQWSSENKVNVKIEWEQSLKGKKLVGVVPEELG